MHQSYDDQQREYSRVEAYIPFECRIVSQDEKARVKARITRDIIKMESKPAPENGNSDPVVEGWLKIINAKLDMVIRLLKLQQDGYFGLAFKAVNISGGGMSFTLPQAVPMGEVLEIKIMLTFQHPVVMTVYGEVVKVISVKDGHLIGVHFMNMDEHIRDEIVRFVFEREREIIRERRQ